MIWRYKRTMIQFKHKIQTMQILQTIQKLELDNLKNGEQS